MVRLISEETQASEIVSTLAPDWDWRCKAGERAHGTEVLEDRQQEH